ncbi:MAG: hypothetical protein ABW007_11365 [Chitinophagaceae bacterium]
MAVRFNFDKDFDDNVYRASNKTNSSLKPLYNQVRSKTDEIAEIAKTSIKREAGSAESDVDSIKNSKWESNYGGKGRHGWLAAKAKAFALKSAAQSVAPSMGYDGREIYGRVSINRRGSDTLEFGGPDPVAELGKGSGEYLVHPPYSFLRNAMRRAV